MDLREKKKWLFLSLLPQPDQVDVWAKPCNVMCSGAGRGGHRAGQQCMWGQDSCARVAHAVERREKAGGGCWVEVISTVWTQNVLFWAVLSVMLL